MKSGTKIKWQYTHWLNSVSSIERIKHGIFIRLVNHRQGYRGYKTAIVIFKGNKHFSRVPFSELVEEKN